MEEFGDNMKARMLAKDLLQGADVKTFKDVAETLQQNRTALLRLDHTFLVELAYVKVADGALQTAVQMKVISLLASQETPMTLHQAHASVKDLQKHAMLGHASKATQGPVKTVLEILSNMQRGISPEFSSNVTAFHT